MVRTFQREATDLLMLVWSSKDGSAVESLTVTSEHPFWVEGRGWVRARLLSVGDQAFTGSGLTRILIRSDELSRRATVYNLEVEATHTYFVGAGQILAHNACRAPSPGAAATVDARTGQPVGRFIADSRGNVMIEPQGGRTVGNPQGTFAETRYPNGSPYQQLHGPHGHIPDLGRALVETLEIRPGEPRRGGPLPRGYLDLCP